MARARYISDRLTDALHRPQVRAFTPHPIEWRALPVPVGGRHGWLPPVRLTRTEGALVAFCPEMIDAATDELDTAELDRFLGTFTLFLDAHLAFPGLDAATVARRVEAHLDGSAPADRALHARVTAQAFDLAHARLPPPRPRTPPDQRIDPWLHLQMLVHDTVDVELVPLGERERVRCPGGFRRMDLRRRQFPVDTDLLTVWSTPLDDDQHHRWLDFAATCAYVAGQCHRYVTTPDRVVDELFAKAPEAALFAGLLASHRHLLLAEFLGEHG